MANTTAVRRTGTARKVAAAAGAAAGGPMPLGSHAAQLLKSSLHAATTASAGAAALTAWGAAVTAPAGSKRQTAS
jgi:hypothetical protein